MGAVMARRARDAGATRARVGSWMIMTVGLSPIAFVGVMRARTHRGGVGEGRWEGSRRLVPYDLGEAQGWGRDRGVGSREWGVGSGDDGGGCAITVVAVSPYRHRRHHGCRRRDATRRDAREGPSRGRDATRD